MANVFSEIVSILADDMVVVRERFKFSQKLGISSANVHQLLNNYIQGVVTNYELLHGILREWIQIKGNSATVAELQRTLKANDWNFCSDKLSLIEKSSPGPIISPDASTSAKSAVERIPSTSQTTTTIEPFGFGNVVINFTGRDEEINKLSEYFHSDNCPFVLLTGLGGIGKTQLATKFASDITSTVENPLSLTRKEHKTARDNSQIIKSWLAGENAKPLQKSIAKFSKHLNLPTKDSEKKPFKLEKLLTKIMKKLKTTNDIYKWIVVIDNVDEEYDEFETVAKMLVSFGAQIFILVTSRNRHIFSGEVKHFPLEPIETSSSVLFVKKSLQINSGSGDEFIIELCKQLGNFPLALGQAVAYIKQQQTISLKCEKYRVEDYLGELSKQGTAGLDKESKLTEYQWSTLKVWNITFDKIKNSYGESGNQALKLLDVLSFLNPDGMVQFLLPAVLSLFNMPECKENVEKSLELLLKYSLINMHVRDGSKLSEVRIHRLVQLAIRKRMHFENPTKEVELLKQFWTNFQSKRGIYHTRSYELDIWKHSINCHNLELDRIRASVVHRLFDEMYFEPSFDRCKFAVEGCELLLRLFEGESLQYLTMQRRLITYRPEKKDSLLEKLLTLNDKLTVLVGEKHIETLTTGNCISKVLHDWGRKSDSIEWCQRLRHCFSRIIGQEDITIIKIKEEVANRLGSMGCTKEAVDMLEEILKRNKLDSGQLYDNDVLKIRINIVKYLSLDGKCSEAKVKLAEFIILTENSDYVPWIKDRFADIMEKFGEFQVALDLKQEVSEGWEKVFGAQHYLSVGAQSKIAELRRKLAESD